MNSGNIITATRENTVALHSFPRHDAKDISHKLCGCRSPFVCSWLALYLLLHVAQQSAQGALDD